jgi:hypothetical protein
MLTQKPVGGRYPANPRIFGIHIPVVNLSNAEQKWGFFGDLDQQQWPMSSILVWWRGNRAGRRRSADASEIYHRRGGTGTNITFILVSAAGTERSGECMRMRRCLDLVLRLDFNLCYPILSSLSKCHQIEI